MKLTLVQHGGWGAALRRQPIAVDTDVLPTDVGNEFLELASAAERADVRRADARPVPPVPDGISYEIILDRDGHIVTLKGSDASSPREFLELEQAIRKHAPKP